MWSLALCLPLFLSGLSNAAGEVWHGKQGGRSAVESHLLRSEATARLVGMSHGGLLQVRTESGFGEKRSAGLCFGPPCVELVQHARCLGGNSFAEQTMQQQT